MALASSPSPYLEITQRCPCLGGCVPRDSALRIRAVPALSNLPPNKISFDRHSSFTVRTQRSAYEFRFGLRGGSRRHFTPPADSVSRNEAQNFVSRSCNKWPILRLLTQPSPSNLPFPATFSLTLPSLR